MDGIFSAMTPFYTAVINRNVEIIFIYLNKGETDLITSGKIDSNSKLCLTFILTFMFIKFFLSKYLSTMGAVSLTKLLKTSHVGSL